MQITPAHGSMSPPPSGFRPKVGRLPALPEEQPLLFIPKKKPLVPLRAVLAIAAGFVVILGTWEAISARMPIKLPEKSAADAALLSPAAGNPKLVGNLALIERPSPTPTAPPAAPAAQNDAVIDNSDRERLLSILNKD